MKTKFSFPVFITTCLGVGYAPIAPGTVASLFAIPIYIATRSNLTVFTLVTAVLIITGFLLSGKAERTIGTRDPKHVVIDDLSGALVAFYLIPGQYWCMAFAFIMFRVFDIIKPYPIGNFERKYHGSKGIMMDDMLAGLYANLATQIVAKLIL